MTAPLEVAVAALASSALMSGLWLIGRRVRNWSVVDPGWAISVVLCALVYATASGAPWTAHRVVTLACAATWGLRHAFLLLKHRVIGRPEEGRYVELRARWGSYAFFAFFQAQALLAVILSLPFLLACRSTATAVPVPAVLVFGVGLLGEAIADAQLRAWTSNPAHRGRTCRRGLWAWSRHPNYFFEFVIWCAFALLGSSHLYGFLAFTAPAIILLLLLFVTGIPPAERQALRSRGDDYRAYQRTTSAFVPWPRRAEPPNRSKG